MSPQLSATRDHVSPPTRQQGAGTTPCVLFGNRVRRITQHSKVNIDQIWGDSQETIDRHCQYSGEKQVCCAVPNTSRREIQHRNLTPNAAPGEGPVDSLLQVLQRSRRNIISYFLGSAVPFCYLHIRSPLLTKTVYQGISNDIVCCC